MFRRIFFLILALLLAACVPAAPPSAADGAGRQPATPTEEAAAVVPTAASTPEPAESPTATPEPTATVALATPTNTAIPSPTPLGPGLYTFTDGYGGDVDTAKDVLLNSSAGFINTGKHRNFELAPIQNSLLEFDLSSIPAEAKVVKATLYLYNTYGTGGGKPISTIYSVSAANADWTEGERNLKQAFAGETTWDALAANGAGGVAVPWAGDAGKDGGADAGCSVRGVDTEPDPIGQFAWDPFDPIGTEYAIALDPERVSGWLGPENTNYGIIIYTAGGVGHVAQSDHAETQYRPKLVVEYEIAP